MVTPAPTTTTTDTNGHSLPTIVTNSPAMVTDRLDVITASKDSHNRPDNIERCQQWSQLSQHWPQPQKKAAAPRHGRSPQQWPKSPINGHSLLTMVTRSPTTITTLNNGHSHSIT